MSYISLSKVVHIDHNTYYVNARHGGVFTSYMKSIVRQFRSMLDYHSRVLVLRIDLRVYRYTPDNRMITRFNRLLLKWIRRTYDMKRVGFCWCRETGSREHQHYHYALMLNGHKVRHPHRILQKARAYWDEYLQGSLYVPENCYYMVSRGDDSSIQEVVYRLSYLAKANGKISKPQQTKHFNSSRLRFQAPRKSNDGSLRENQYRGQ